MLSIRWPKQAGTQLIVFTIVIALCIFFHLLGFGGHIGLSYKAGQYGNQWVPFWGATLGLIIDFQACYMLYKCWRKILVERKIIWSIYCAWMFILAVMIIIGDGIISKRGEITGVNGILAIWGATWILTLFVIINITWFEHIQHLCDTKVSSENILPPLIHDNKLPPIFLMSKSAKSFQGEGDQWLKIAKSHTAIEQTVRSSKSSSCCCRKCCTVKCTIKGIGWSSIGFLSFFGFLLAMQAVWSANDVLNYGSLGERVTIQMSTQMNLSNVASVISQSKIKMHILCKGPINSGSTFILEAGAGSFSASFFALQDRLVAGGRRCCIYDRAGYGWSDVLPILTNSYQPIFHLQELLIGIAEAPPYIMIGHSFGGQLIQLYAALFPNQISGLAMLDSVPDFIYPLSLSGKPMNSNVTFADLQPYVTVAKSTIDTVRAGTPFGIHRWFQQAPTDYQSANLSNYYNAGYGKPLNWHAQYFDYIGTPTMIEILDNLSSQKYLNGFGWPTLRNTSTPVLGIITNSTAGGPGPLCSSSIDSSCTSDARIGRAYYDGMQLQTTTLSSNSTFIVCDAPCSHSFVSTNKVDWLAQTILAKFVGV
jgi:pimeloyl-ACP methyl ester carboxylesterase